MSWRSVRHLFTSAGIVGAAVLAFAGPALADSAQPSPAFATNGSFGPVINFDGKCLDMTNRSTQLGTQPQIWTCNGQPQQQWQFISLGNGTWLVQNENSRLCLSILNNSTAQAAAVDQWTCSTSNRFEAWRIVPVAGTNDVEIANVGDGGLVMHPQFCLSADGTKIVVNVSNQCRVDFWHG